MLSFLGRFNMKDVAILVVADGIPQDIRTRFKMCIDKSNPTASYDVLIMGNVDSKEKVFNKCKMLNKGLKSIIGKYKVIIQADIDLIVPPMLIDKTFSLAMEKDVCVHHCMICIPPEEFNQHSDYDKFPLTKWKTFKKVYATGCWNGLKSSLWKKTGGFNEEMTNWGYEDRDWRYRAIACGIPWKDVYNFPLIHVNHPRRNRDVSKQNIDISKKAKQEGKTNWL